MSFPLDGLPPKMLPSKCVGNHGFQPRIHTIFNAKAKARRFFDGLLLTLLVCAFALNSLINDTRTEKFLEFFSKIVST
jgi:hypothetical protein